MFGWEFPPHITGGLGTACYGLTKGLMKQDVDILFVVPKAYGDEDQQAVRLVNASDVHIDVQDTEMAEHWKHLTYMEIGSNLVPYLDPVEFERQVSESKKTETTITKHSILGPHYEFSGSYGINLMEEVSRYALVAANIARQYDYDVIHAHDWLTYAAGIAAKEVSGKPLVLHMHATEFDRSGEHNINRQVFDIEKSGMEAADMVITVSNLTRKIVIERYGIDPDKVVTVYNGVMPKDKSHVHAIQRNVKEKVVTFLGRITFQKGPEYFVEAAYKVLQKDENVRFVMAGKGDMLNTIVKRVAQLRMGTRFHFTGFLNLPDVDRMFGMSDVYVMPSVSEPFGISPLEALRSNVPVVISKQSGVAEILKHALKVDFWDIDALADSIYGVLHYDAMTKMFLRYGKDEVEKLQWEKAAKNTLEVYKKVLQQKEISK
ncbi:MAG: glycosyltransferase [Bacteroidales bacterium]|nr:glycosyltransferase [Bacteroidales bacterium]